MPVLVDTIVSLYEFTDADIASLESTLFEQLRLAWLEQMRALAVRHGVANPTPTLQGADLERLQGKAREDALSIANTYNRELRNQVEAIYARNPGITRNEMISILESWGRKRDEYKSIQVALAIVMWAVYYGLQQFVIHNGLFNELFEAVGGTPVCPICMRIVGDGIVSYDYTVANPLPAHISCSHEYYAVNPQDLARQGVAIWVGQ